MMNQGLVLRGDWAAVCLSLVATVLLAVLPSEIVPRVIAAVIVIGLIAWITWQDAVTFLIPDGAVAGIVLVGAGLRLGAGIDALHDPWLVIAGLGVDAAACAGTLFLLREIFYRRRGYDGLGFGDVKLGLAGGVLIGAQGFAWATCGACAAALVFVLGRRSGGRPLGAQDRVALGAFLAPAILLAWVVGRMVPSLDATGF